MDELVGGVLGAVDSAGFTDNTVVIFHADHGYFMGESVRFPSTPSFSRWFFNGVPSVFH